MTYSARYRAATRTITTGSENKKLLDEIRSEHGVLASLLDSSKFHSNPWWTSPPVCDLVYEAREQFGGKFGDLKAVARPADRLNQDEEHRKRGPGVQALVYKHILPILYPIDFATEIARRVRLWSRLDLLGVEEVVAGRFGILKALSPGVAFSVFKTWFNTWPTNFRMHLPARNCLFCGQGPDRLSHIIVCQSLWSSVYAACGLDAPDQSVPINPVTTLALDSGGRDKFKEAVCSLHLALTVYQDIRDKPTYNIRNSLKTALQKYKKHQAHSCARSRMSAQSSSISNVATSSLPRESARPPAARNNHDNRYQNNSRFDDLVAAAAASGIRMPQSFGGVRN